MKNKLMALLAISGLLVALQVGASAVDNVKTITGEGACAKCILKETKECQLTVTAEEGGKPVTYYLTENQVAKDFGSQLCKERRKIQVSGTVKIVDGKHMLDPTKIEFAKE
jgi:hypothetical protein